MDIHLLRGAFGFFLIGSLVLASGCAEMTGGHRQGTRTASSPGTAGAKPTTGGGGAHAYAVTIGVKNNAGRLGSVQFNARGPGKGAWHGGGANVACTNLTGRAMHACNGQGATLSCGLIDTGGIGTPGGLVTCTFDAAGALSAGDISVKVVDATDVSNKAVNANVAVTNITAK